MLKIIKFSLFVLLTAIFVGCGYQPSSKYVKNVFDESFHALLLVKLLQIRHEKQLGKTSYDDLLLSIVSAFDLADQSISLEERSILIKSFKLFIYFPIL